MHGYLSQLPAQPICALRVEHSCVHVANVTNVTGQPRQQSTLLIMAALLQALFDPNVKYIYWPVFLYYQ